jgi:hypothetical protein
LIGSAGALAAKAMNVMTEDFLARIFMKSRFMGVSRFQLRVAP